MGASVPSLSKVLTQGLPGRRVSCEVGGRQVACSPGPSTHFPIRSQASLMRAEDSRGVCGLEVWGILCLHGHSLLLSSAQRTQSLKEGVGLSSAWLLETGGVRTARESCDSPTVAVCPLLGPVIGQATPVLDPPCPCYPGQDGKILKLRRRARPRLRGSMSPSTAKYLPHKFQQSSQRVQCLHTENLPVTKL